ncbi:MAG: ribose-5-phosphate isomerase A [archaeon]
MIPEEKIDAFLEKYVKANQAIGIGTSELGEKFARRLGIRIESENLKVRVVPTSAAMAMVLHEMRVPTIELGEKELDLAFEFVSMADEQFNFIKRETTSLIRDKIIAKSALELIIITEENNYGKTLYGSIPFELSHFGWKHTLLELEKLGRTKLREKNGKPALTESGHLLADVQVDSVYSPDDIEIQGHAIPGVIETGLFVGYADRIVLHGQKITVKSRLGK